MSKITAILEPQEDGKLHLPVPEGMRHQKIRVTAVLEPMGSTANKPRFGSYAGKIWMAPDFDGPLPDFKEYME